MLQWQKLLVISAEKRIDLLRLEEALLGLTFMHQMPARAHMCNIIKTFKEIQI